MDWFSQLSTPAQVSAALSVLNIAPIIANTGSDASSKIGMVTANVLVALVWIWIINSLYMSGWTGLAWILAIGFPLAVLLFVVFVVFAAVF